MFSEELEKLFQNLFGKMMVHEELSHNEKEEKGKIYYIRY